MKEWKSLRDRGNLSSNEGGKAKLGKEGRWRNRWMNQWLDGWTDICLPQVQRRALSLISAR